MPTLTTSTRPTSIFISYSRKDKLFVRKLNDALDSAGIAAWVDWEGIPLSSDWMVEITNAIEGADAFLFVISPNSLSSKVCAQELEEGLKRNKKLIPILYRDPEKGSELHPKLGATNWVYMRPKKDDFKATVPKLIEAIHTDLGWVQQHTRILQRATEWDRKNRNGSYLLQGSDLEDGERWMTESAAVSGRSVLPLQAEYISASRKGAIKRQRSLLTGVALALLVSVALGVFALFQWNQSTINEGRAKDNAATALANQYIASTQQALAENNAALARESAALAAKKENEAKSQRSAALSKIYEERTGEMDISSLLALDSWGRLPSVQAEDILRHNISLMALPVALIQHANAVTNIHPSADGATFVTSSDDGSACVWAMQNASLKYCVRHESGEMQEAFLTKDNSLLVTAGADGTVRFWNGADGTLDKTFAFNSRVWDIDLSADNHWVAVGRADGMMTLLDLKTKKEEVSFDLSAGEIYTVVFDPTSVWLALGTSKGFVTLWRVNSGTSIAGARHTGEVYAIAFSKDGNWVVSGGADSMARLTKTVSGGQKFALKHGDWVEDVAFSPNNDWFVAASDDNLIHVWDVKTGAEKFRMAHGDFVLRVEVSPDGQWIASASFDKTVRIWNAASGSLMKEISLNSVGSSLAFSADGKRLITGERSGRVGVWDISELNARVGYIIFPEIIRKAKFNATGDWILLNSDDKNFWQIPSSDLTVLHDGTAGKKVLTLENISGQFKISADSKWIVLSEIYGKRAILYNLETKINFTLPLDADVTGLAFSADNSKVATTYDKGKSVIIWNVATGEKLDEIKFDQVAFTISFDPKGATLAIGFQDKTVLWDLAAKKEIATLNQIGEIRSLTYNRDGSWLATTSSDGSVNLWDMKANDFSQPKYNLLQGGGINSLDFSHDNRWLASGGGDGFAYLWDLSTGEEYARLPHNYAVTSVSFSGDSAMLMTVSRKVVQLWDMSAIVPIKTDNIVQMACARLVKNFSESAWKYFFNDEPYKRICENLPVPSR